MARRQHRRSNGVTYLQQNHDGSSAANHDPAGVRVYQAFPARLSWARQHVLPKGFKKVRHYGFLASRNKQLLTNLQYQFGTVEITDDEQQEQKPAIPVCPVCAKPMVLIETVKPGGFQAKRIPAKAGVMP